MNSFEAWLINMTIDDLKEKNCIIYECLSGSRAYGLDLPESDTDIKGVFILPEDDFYKLDYIPQINNETNDIVYYELKRFIELCYKNNPNILEMLYTSENDIFYRHPVFDKLLKVNFLTKKCEKTFAGYANSQIKKAKGLKKKIFNPIEKKKKTILDFCFVLDGNNSIPLIEWLKINSFKQEKCGLAKVPHMNNIFSLFYDSANNKDTSLGFKGICQKNSSGDISLSSIPQNMKLEAYISYNPDEYSKYCRDYKEYWKWVNNRNENRFKNTISREKNYDSKNMMHTFRLMNMATEIAESETIFVKRDDRDFLLKIKKG